MPHSGKSPESQLSLLLPPAEQAAERLRGEGRKRRSPGKLSPTLRAAPEMVAPPVAKRAAHKAKQSDLVQVGTSPMGAGGRAAPSPPAKRTVRKVKRSDVVQVGASPIGVGSRTASSCQPPRLLSIPAVADRIGVSGKTVRRWIERDELPAHRLGRQLRVSEEGLTAFIENRRQ